MSSKTTSITLEHLPPSYTLHITLFNPLRNAAFLRSQLLSSNPAFEYAFVDASTLISPTHLLAACFRAVNDHAHSRLRSRNVHSEIVFALSAGKNIAESYRAFGITDATTTLIAVKVSTPENPISAEDVSAHLTTNVHGEQVEFCQDQLERCTDLQKVKGIYKLGDGLADGSKTKRKKGAANGNVEGTVDEALQDRELCRKEMEVLAMGMMAVKGS